MTWSQQELLYIGSALLAFAVWFSLLSKSTAPSSVVPAYGPRWLPSFVGSILATYRLGTDEENFLIDCHTRYGPITYLPWPLCQYLVTDSAAIQSIYNTPSKSLVFSPIRNDMNYTVFNTSPAIFSSRFIEERVFPAHAKGLARGQLATPLERFITSIEGRIAALGDKVEKTGESAEIELVDVVNEMVFEGASDALFGTELCSSSHSDLTRAQLREAFIDFDASFPLLASGLAAGLLPAPLHRFWPKLDRGVKARSVLTKHFAKWARAGLPGLEEGVTKDIVEIGMNAQVGDEEMGKILLGSFWALQANAPFAAVHQLLYLTQTPLLPSILKEMDEHLATTSEPYSFATLSSSTALPLLTSTLYETLRLSASSFSIRLVLDRDGYVFTNTSQAIPPIPYHSRIICCATTMLDVEGDEDSAEWDGERFDGEEGRRKALREVRAFGGGISVCEGRQLAMAKLKALSIMLLTNFNFSPILSQYNPKETRELRFKGGKKGVAPKTLLGRAGMGVRQVAMKAPYTVEKRSGSA